MWMPSTNLLVSLNLDTHSPWKKGKKVENIPFNFREETYSWSFTSTQMSREDVLFMDLITWMSLTKASNMSESDLKDWEYCYNPRSFQSNRCILENSMLK